MAPLRRRAPLKDKRTVSHPLARVQADSGGRPLTDTDFARLTEHGIGHTHTGPDSRTSHKDAPLDLGMRPDHAVGLDHRLADPGARTYAGAGAQNAARTYARAGLDHRPICHVDGRHEPSVGRQRRGLRHEAAVTVELLVDDGAHSS